LNTLLENLALNTKRLDTVFAGLQGTPMLLNRTLNTANANINDLSTSFKSVAGNLNSSLQDLKPTLANFQTLSDSLKRIELNGTISKAQQSLVKLNETLSRLNKGDNTMSKLMTEDTLYVSLNKALKSIDSLANHFNEYPRHFLAPLGKSRKKIQRELKSEKE
jgi:phospholipid/cholesterol/gamma-HCH transport system substrate-binding protein